MALEDQNNVDDNAVEPKKKTATRKKKSAKHKKSPQAPKRFKSAYIFFSSAKHPEIRANLGKDGEHMKVCEFMANASSYPGCNNYGFFRCQLIFVLVRTLLLILRILFYHSRFTQTPGIAKLVAEAWRNLPSEERKVWDKKALEDKERYELEKKTYGGPWTIPSNDGAVRRKDPDKPKRPMSAFLAYSNSKRAGLKRNDATLTNADISRVLAKAWKEADVEDKKVYIDEEFILRQKYKQLSEEWRRKAELKREADRKIKEEEEMEKREKEIALTRALQEEQMHKAKRGPSLSESRAGQLGPSAGLDAMGGHGMVGYDPAMLVGHSLGGANNSLQYPYPMNSNAMDSEARRTQLLAQLQQLTGQPAARMPDQYGGGAMGQQDQQRMNDVTNIDPMNAAAQQQLAMQMQQYGKASGLAGNGGFPGNSDATTAALLGGASYGKPSRICMYVFYIVSY